MIPFPPFVRAADAILYMMGGLASSNVPPLPTGQDLNRMTDRELLLIALERIEYNTRLTRVILTGFACFLVAGAVPLIIISGLVLINFLDTLRLLAPP